MGPDANCGDILWHPIRRCQRNTPQGGLEPLPRLSAGRSQVIASGQYCRSLGTRRLEYLPFFTDPVDLSRMINGYAIAQAVDLIAVVRYHQGRALKCAQQLGYCLLHLLPQAGVQSRKRFIQHEDGRFGRHDARQGGALLLTA